MLTMQVCLRGIFTAILGGFMDHQFGLDVKRALLRPMVEGSIEVYLRVSRELLPTPDKAHYTFSLRDLSKVFQGILMIKSRQVSTPHCSPQVGCIHLWACKQDMLVCKHPGLLIPSASVTSKQDCMLAASPTLKQ